MKLNLSPVERAIADLASAEETDFDEENPDLFGWTLVGMDDHEFVYAKGWTSPLARRLRARGFPAKMRRVEGGYETWAKWPEEAL